MASLPPRPGFKASPSAHSPQASDFPAPCLRSLLQQKRHHLREDLREDLIEIVSAWGRLSVTAVMTVAVVSTSDTEQSSKRLVLRTQNGSCNPG